MAVEVTHGADGTATVFTKLASQLTASKLADLAIIPFIFVAQIGVSWLCAWIVSKLFGFGKRPRNFVTAMAVRRRIGLLVEC